MVEAMANSVEDYLIDGLSFKLSPGASYVTNRRTVTWDLKFMFQVRARG